MAPSRPAPTSNDDDDLDDLDNLVSEFQSTSVASTSSPAPPPTKPTTSSKPTITDETDDFPDPDSPTLSAIDPDLDLDDAAFAKEFEASLAQLMSSLGTEGEAGGLDSAELKKVMEEILAGSGAGGGFDGDAEATEEQKALLAALTGGPPSGFKNPQPSSSSSSSFPSTSTTKTATSPPAVPKSFQETISSTLGKMKDSSAAVDAQTSASGEQDPLAAMMAQMAGLEGLEGAGGEAGLQGMLDEMMEQLMSRELLYTPLKELSVKYPAYLEKNASTLSTADVDRFKKQQVHVNAIVAKFEEPGADKTENLTAAEEARAKKRTKEVSDLVKEMNDCGAPPTELMGEMPAGMELGPDGVPKLPTDCTIS